ncbi:MAG: hypothetical protein WA989_05275 [Henriciella sp.]|uniref:hypothetical protein n=1 Tax=Henriciella sp. TaxID=1968823 RepID=UPI003C727A71
MMSAVTAEACAQALIASAREGAADLSVLRDLDPEALPEDVWFKWRCLAATALIHVGYDPDQVHRVMEIESVRVPSEAWKIPNLTSASRASAAVLKLSERALYPRCEV